MTQTKRIFSILVFVMAAFMLTSCNKEEVAETITESEAVEIVETSLQSSSGGMTSNAEDVAEEMVTATAAAALCDTLYTETIEKDYQGAQVQASYTSDLSYELTCNNLSIPQSVAFTVNTASVYSSARIAAEGDSDFTGNASGLQPSTTTIILSGNYSSVGTQELYIKDQKSVTSTITAELTDLEINKETFEIKSGSGTFTLTGMTKGASFSFSGSIIFNGNKTATITINGTPHMVDWN